MRNPKWHRDEIILALDLYFSKDRGSVDSRNPKVIELSKLLNQLPLFIDRPDREKFRNANGVSLKLSNFQHFDPDYPGKGMDGGSNLDEEIFNEFYNQREKLSKIAKEIKELSTNKELQIALSSIEEDEQTENDEIEEGSVVYKLHKFRERNAGLSKKKKQQALKKTGKLSCEVCSMDFYEFYGEIGKGFIECHHKVPISSLNASQKTKLEDLALVCSNCHRMLHRCINTITISELTLLITRKN